MLGRIFLGIVIAAGLSFAPQARATTFDFTYFNPDGLSGHVHVSGTQSSPDAFAITSGTDTVTGGAGLTGVFTLLQNLSYPAAMNSPSGYFTYDNLLTPGLNPFVNLSGLLFTSGTNEVNVYSTGPGNYIHYDNTGFNTPINMSALTITQNTNDVPEPVTIALLGSSLVGLGFIRRTMRRLPTCE